MRVLVTGASGFLGCHTVGHLLDAGQQVQVLARDPDRLDAALGPVGYRSGDVSVVSGDMTDPASVAAAVAGCDAVVHAAAVYSLDPRQHEVMRATNALGTRLVLESAAEAGAQRIVHVSSYSTLVQPNQTIRPDGPLTSLTTPYILSKVESEKIARGLRDRGAPVFVVNPPGLIGPDDPYCGDTNRIVMDVLKSRVPMWPRGSIVWGDTRDTAATIVAMLSAQSPSSAYFGPSTTLPDLAPLDALRRVTGRSLRTILVPASVALTAARAIDPVASRLPAGWRLPGSDEGGQLACANPRVDDSTTRDGLGITGRPIDDALLDTVVWLHQTGRISARQAGTALR
ncbi:MAG: SDR family NAD(P)-dependent oxidoreductase [Jiangellales bacterium]